ncbi:DUF551 domain-containing protein [Klebsiella pneumoniae]|uniref:DUF551 domain-containing protein n=1 Tax=Klebsiella pneumoniae TaxID=573 RepID=UPI00053891E8|nr:DUF551 domain-containing protein [Klebsiella pneumoniae]PNO82936.1 DUF551 domain-containing protein [Klebsiella pneumoniae]
MSEFSRETLLNIIETDHVQCGEASALARIALAAIDSEPVELPLDYLQGHKDCLEWAAKLAEANHPETGDWLYDDPIELAKAIRKGPDMPQVQPVADSEPVAEITEDLGRLFVKIHYPTTLRAGDKLYRHAQPAPAVPEEIKRNPETGWYVGPDGKNWSALQANSWNACRAAMLAAAPQSPGSEPATVPGKWIPVSERMPEVGDIVLTAMGGVVNVGEMECSAANCLFFTSVISGRELPATHWMPLPAAPQEGK